jgi:ABC-type tungstate transport system permease subunit
MIVRDAANAEGARAFVDWITGPDAQTLIRDYGVDASGHGLFTATASPDVM